MRLETRIGAYLLLLLPQKSGAVAGSSSGEHKR